MQLSRDEPGPLPGGHRVGASVYYKGASRSSPTGERWEYGALGEVAGPATGDESTTHVAVKFAFNGRSVECPLTNVRRLPSVLDPSHRTLLWLPPRVPRRRRHGRAEGR